MKNTIIPLIILSSCGFDNTISNNTSDSSFFKIKKQADTWDGKNLYELNCMQCHMNPRTLDLNHIDSTLEHRNNLTFYHIAKSDKIKIINFIKASN